MFLRGNTCWIKRCVPGMGHVTKSLGTKNRARGRALEAMLLDLAANAQQGVIRAWLDGRLTLAEIAEAHAAGTMHEIVALLREPASVTLAAAIRACEAEREGDIAPGTLERYREGWAHFRRYSGDDTSVREALATKSVNGFRPSRRNDGVAKATANNDLAAVSVLATFCVDQGWIAERPRIKKFKATVRTRYLEPKEIIVYMANTRRAFRLLFQVLIGTGLRFGEAAGLRVCDVKFGEREARALIDDSKTPEGVRTVFVPAWVAEGLKAEIEERGLSGTDPVFAVEYYPCWREHRRACRAAGIVRYTIHDHRHTAAVALARAGMPLHLLAGQLGHSGIQMTMRYAKFNPNYADVSPYFEQVAESLGLSGYNPGYGDVLPEKAGKA